MSLYAHLRPLGYVHRRDLVEAGWRADAVRAAISAERLTVYRRQWIVRPDAEPSIHLAARYGGVVTCVAAEGLLTVWRPGHDRTPHIALAPHSSSSCPGAVVHRAEGIVPRPPRLLVDPIQNVLAMAATCLPFEDALAVWESSVHKRLIRPDQLTSTAWRGPRAKELARVSGVLSDSGLETLFAQRLRVSGIQMRQQVWICGRPVDGLIGARLVVQIDGFEHQKDAAQRRADIAHDRMLRLAGYTVLRYDYQQVTAEWPRVEAEILAAIAQCLHLSRPPGTR